MGNHSAESLKQSRTLADINFSSKVNLLLEAVSKHWKKCFATYRTTRIEHK